MANTTENDRARELAQQALTALPMEVMQELKKITSRAEYKKTRVDDSISEETWERLDDVVTTFETLTGNLKTYLGG